MSTRPSKRRVEPGRWGKAVEHGLLGMIVGFGAGWTIGGPIFALVFCAIAGLSMYVYGALVIEGAGDLVARLFIGRLVETQTDYSYADSLVARGMYDAAARAYEEAAVENPRDPEPLMRMARVLRDHLGRPEDAVAAFKRARAAKGAKPGQVQLSTREIVETLASTDQPLRAIPELARLAEQGAGTKSGEWALRRLEELKQELAWTIKGQGQGQAQAQGEAGARRGGSGTGTGQGNAHAPAHGQGQAQAGDGENADGKG